MTRVTAERSAQVAVLGAGSWGTALAHLLLRNGHRVALWSFEEEIVAGIRDHHRNPVYLAEIELPSELVVSTRIEEVVRGAEVVISVTPSQFVRKVLQDAAQHLAADAIVVSASKGIEVQTLSRMDQVIADVLPGVRSDRIIVLSGPSFAREVAAGKPTAVVAAGASAEACAEVQRILSGPAFRVYTSRDSIGLEVGGAVKNVIAIAAGISDGLRLGHNAKAALITRGVAEMARLGVAMGAEAETFYGLAGVGDLVLTCTGELSRNRSVGERIGRGESLKEILADMRSVAEGVATAPAIQALARRYGIETPIVDQVCAILEGRTGPSEAVRDLLVREATTEF
jgi:glycerol-3-phosphate dehydrogenase (NAD(P)+)